MKFTKDIEFNSSPAATQELILTYHGFLANSSELTIVYGFGESWNHTTETPMEKTSSGFCAKINMLDFDTFNFCFRNSNNEWDNNGNCNYISSILPCTTSTFNLDALIQELLEPITFKPVEKTEDSTPVKVFSNPIDLGVEISKILSQIDTQTAPEDLIEYSTLDEILSGTVIEETPIELFEINTEKFDVQLLQESISEAITELFEAEAHTEEKSTIAETIENKEQTALINVKDPFMISPRQLSRFYLFKKRIKLALYKALVKLPKLIFGSQEQ